MVEALNQLFSKFDHLCAYNLCYKVCTIGDCYVALGYRGDEQGVKREPGKELLRILRFSNQLIEAIEQTNKELNTTLQMRIGVHVGTCIGGVVGSNIVRYDIYGSDVMVANKMESNGAPGRINVSEFTKNLLKLLDKSLSFEFNQRVEIKLRMKENSQDIFTNSYFVN